MNLFCFVLFLLNWCCRSPRPLLGEGVTLSRSHNLSPVTEPSISRFIQKRDKSTSQSNRLMTVPTGTWLEIIWPKVGLKRITNFHFPLLLLPLVMTELTYRFKSEMSLTGVLTDVVLQIKTLCVRFLNRSATTRVFLINIIRTYLHLPDRFWHHCMRQVLVTRLENLLLNHQIYQGCLLVHCHLRPFLLQTNL